MTNPIPLPMMTNMKKNPQVEVDEEVDNWEKFIVDKLEKVYVDNIKCNEHTHVVMHGVVVDPSQIGVDENFHDDNGEQVVHNGFEQHTQKATIKIENELFNKEKRI